MTEKAKPFGYFLLLLIIWAGTFLTSLGSFELRGEEGRRCLPGMGMIKSGNWILPYMSGRPYINKPPMINWLAAGSVLLCGEKSEWPVRLPSPLFILLFITVLVWVPNRALSLEQRVLMALFYLTTLSILEKGRQIEIEAVYISTTALAAYWWFRGWLGGYSPWSTWLGSAVFITIGMLTKGPVILIVFYAMILFVIAAEKKWRCLLAPAHLLSVALWGGIFYLWTHAASAQVDTQALVSRWNSEMLVRIIPKTIDWGNRAEVLLRSLLNLMPWLLLAPLFWKKEILSAIPSAKLPFFKAIRNAAVICYLILTLLPGSEARYSLPVVPLLCLLLGWVATLQPANSAKDRQTVNILLPILWAMPAVSLILIFIAGFEPATLLPLFAALALGAGAYACRKRITGPAPVVLLLALVITAGMMNYAVFGSMLREDHQSRKPWGLKINQQVPPGQTIYAYDPENQIFLFYVREPLDYITQPSQITPQVSYLLVSQDKIDRDQLQPLIDARKGQILLEFDYSTQRGHFILYHLE